LSRKGQMLRFANTKRKASSSLQPLFFIIHAITIVAERLIPAALTTTDDCKTNIKDNKKAYYQCTSTGSFRSSRSFLRAITIRNKTKNNPTFLQERESCSKASADAFLVLAKVSDMQVEIYKPRICLIVGHIIRDVDNIEDLSSLKFSLAKILFNRKQNTINEPQPTRFWAALPEPKNSSPGIISEAHKDCFDEKSCCNSCGFTGAPGT
jgi:hypothetical protein